MGTLTVHFALGLFRRFVGDPNPDHPMNCGKSLSGRSSPAGKDCIIGYKAPNLPRHIDCSADEGEGFKLHPTWLKLATPCEGRANSIWVFEV